MSWDPKRVYEADKRAAELCTLMSINGFRFDRDRAAELRAHLITCEADALAQARAVAGMPELNPYSGKQLQHAYFDRLRAPVYFRSKLTGKPSLGVDALRAYAAGSDEALRALSLAILDARRARKVRATYIDAIIGALDTDDRIHPSWLNYGAVSGRWACQGPNLMNLPRLENDPTAALGGIRSLYGAPPGRRILAFDCKQLEMRVAAYASGDPAMILACNSSDLHTANAEVIFGERFLTADPAMRKALRSLAKSSGFAVCYMAAAETVYARLLASGVNVKLREVEAMLARMRRAFRRYYGWQADRLLEVIRDGYVYSPILGRRRWLGHDPLPTEAANFPIQGGAADFMNIRLPMLLTRVQRDAVDALLVAQVHDSAVFEVAECDVERLTALAFDVMQAPIVIASSGTPLDAVLPIDLDVGERWH